MITLGSTALRHAINIRELLCSAGLDSPGIQKVIDSGYLLVPTASGLVLCDSFYGNKASGGFHTPQSIFEFARSGKRKVRAVVPHFKVSSIQQLENILESEKSLCNYHSMGRMTFRGQSREYFTKRPFPNPVQSGDDGRERLILPSFWRQFSVDWNARTNPPASIFQTLLGDPLIYHGIPGWQTLDAKNNERYGPHTMSDLEDFPDPESREYHRRWWTFKVEGAMRPELGIISQHYGMETHGLDLTFDPSIACFFATHDFVEDTGKVTCRKAALRNPLGVVYAFVFHDPPVRATHDLINEIDAFAHLAPERPLRQRCALRGFDMTQINQAVTDLAAIFYLEPGFASTKMPHFENLFPPPGQDPFYAALLEVKNRIKGSSGPYSWAVDYEYS